MSIARPDRAAPTARRRARLAAAWLVALLAVVTTAAPTLAAVPAPSTDGSSPARTTSIAPAIATPSPTPDPSASPAPSPSASPDPSPTPTASPSPTPSPTPTPSPQPTPSWRTTVTAVGTSIRFYGRGNGHGVGMSQWGARGRALAGQTSAQILGAYFRGSTPGTTAPARIVRVLVLTGYRAPAAAPLRIHGRSGTWTVDGVTGTFPANASLLAWRTTASVGGIATTTWRIRIVAADGTTTLHAGIVTSFVIVRQAASATRLELDSKGSTYDLYRGRLTLLLNKSSLNVVNRLGLDDYLRGVVPVEMPSTWPTQALKAQAVVARSWTVRHLHPTTGTFDVYDDTRSQVYRGVRAERTVTNALINAAPGALIFSGKSVVNAFYHSASGGWTEDNEDAFVGANGVISSTPLSYLRGVDDRAPGGTAYDAAAPGYAWNTSALTHAQLDAILAADSRTSTGHVLRLDLTHRGASGRLYRVVIYGTTTTKTVSGDIFRLVYNAHRPAGTPSMLSNLFDAAPLR
jgi:stage II sporulation protein D